MRKVLVSILVAVPLAVLAVTALGSSSTLARTLPRVALVAPQSFDGPGVGIGGGLSPYGVALGELVARRDTAALRRLAARDDMSSRLYGLAGLSVLSPAEYEQHAVPLRVSTETVPFHFGCMFGSSDDVGYVVSLIDQPSFGRAYIEEPSTAPIFGPSD